MAQCDIFWTVKNDGSLAVFQTKIKKQKMLGSSDSIPESRFPSGAACLDLHHLSV